MGGRSAVRCIQDSSRLLTHTSCKSLISSSSRIPDSCSRGPRAGDSIPKPDLASFLEFTIAESRNRRWTIALLLGVGVLVNYLDRVNLSVAHDALQRRFAMSDVTYGYLLSAYSWTYAAMQIPSGALLDRFGVRLIMLIAVFLWAAASGFAALAPTIGLLFAARLLLGVGEAPTFPANAKAIGLWFPPQERGLPTATFDAAAKLSIGISTPFLGIVLLHSGLRMTFATTAALSVVYVCLFWFAYRDPRAGETGHAQPAIGSGMREGPSLFDLLAYRKVWGAAVGAGACNYCFYLLLTWMPFYLQRGLQMDTRKAVLWTAVPWLFAAAAGFGIGGRLVDNLLARGNDASLVRRSILCVGTALGLFIFAPAFLHEPRAVLVCLTIALSGISMASPVAWTLPSLLAPPEGIGRVGAFMNLAGQLAAIVAPIVTGYVGQRTHSFRSAFGIAGLVVFVGLLGYAFLLGRISPIELDANAKRRADCTRA